MACPRNCIKTRKKGAQGPHERKVLWYSFPSLLVSGPISVSEKTLLPTSMVLTVLTYNGMCNQDGKKTSPWILHLLAMWMGSTVKVVALTRKSVFSHPIDRREPQSAIGDRALGFKIANFGPCIHECYLIFTHNFWQIFMIFTI